MRCHQQVSIRHPGSDEPGETGQKPGCFLFILIFIILFFLGTYGEFSAAMERLSRLRTRPWILVERQTASENVIDGALTTTLSPSSPAQSKD